MKRFLRSINEKLKKHITVVNNGEEKTYNSLCDMPSTDRMEYILTAMNSCDEDNMTAEQLAMVRQSVKDMMIRQALSRQHN